MSDLVRSLGRAIFEAASYSREFLAGASRPPGEVVRPRLAFQAFSIHLAQFFRPVIEELRTRDDVPDVHFIVLPHPHLPRRAWSDLATYAEEELGILPANIWFWWQTVWESFDMVFYADTYAKFPQRSAVNVLLCHGPAAQRRDFRRGFWRKASSDFDAVIVAGPYDQRQFEAAHRERGSDTAVHLLGFPFLDSLVRGGLTVSRAQYFGRLGLRPDRRTIVFGPHWKVLDLSAAKGIEYFEETIQVLLETDCNIVVKLHAYLCARAPQRDRWLARIAKLDGHPRITVDRDIDDRPALKYGDLLVGDISSRAFMFMLLGKPVITYHPFELEWDDYAARRNTLRRKGSWVASSLDDLRQLLARAELSGARGLEIAHECFAHSGCAAANVADWLLQELGMLPTVSKQARDPAIGLHLLSHF